MVRFTLGNHASAGWVILDGRNMSVAYFNTDTEAAAQAYVEFRNVIDGIRLQQLRDEAHAKVEFIAILERIARDAA